MSELGSGSNSSFPGALDTNSLIEYNKESANKTLVRADVVNDLAAAIVAIEGELGTDPAGNQTDLKTRLAKSMASDGDVGKIRHRLGYSDTLKTAVYDGGSSPVAGAIYADEGTESVDAVTIEVESGTTILGNKSYKLDYTKTSGESAIDVPAIKITDKTDILIDGFEMDGNAANNTYYGEWDHGIRIEGCSRVVIRNMYFHDWSGDCIYIRDCEDVTVENCTFSNPNVNNSGPLVGRCCIGVVNSGADDGNGDTKNIRIINNSFFSGNPAAIDIEPNGTGLMEDIIITNNRFEGDSNTYRAIAIEPASTRFAKKIIVANNLIKDYAYGVLLNVGGTLDNVEITNNVIINCTRGIYSASATHVKIIGNLIDSAGLDGMLLTTNNSEIQIKGNTIKKSTNNGINLGGSSGNENSYIDISGNFIYNNSQTGANTYNGIILNYTDNVKVTNNYCFDNQGVATQKRGLHFADCTDIHVFGNWCDGHVTSNDPYFYNCSNDTNQLNRVGTDLKYESMSIYLTSGSDMFTIDAEAVESASNDVVLIKNQRISATHIVVLLDQDRIDFYQQSVGDAKVGCKHLMMTNTEIAAASVPGNFAADFCVHIQNKSGTNYYIPAKAAAW